ncbi:MAG: BtpA/SgcQ family protein [bacterium]|nr:BtpA/SgcQ family protein [bacterium]MDZ4296555.1 BtpA/SgcQ family protein [Patescibacteria group bacterium]
MERERPSYHEVFPKRHALFPVVHVRDHEQALRNVAMARNCGADGVFLIGHNDCSYTMLLSIYEAVDAAHPDFWIGVNFLDLDPFQAIDRVPRSASGLWADYWGIDAAPADLGSGKYANVEPQTLWEERNTKRSDWPGLCFGGVAFKYRPQACDLYVATQEAVKYMDVVTTSGERTGVPPTHGKIATMRQAAPEAVIAIASGISEENVETFLDLADCFLVSTWISRDFYEFDPKRVEGLVKRIARG